MYRYIYIYIYTRTYISIYICMYRLFRDPPIRVRLSGPIQNPFCTPSCSFTRRPIAVPGGTVDQHPGRACAEVSWHIMETVPKKTTRCGLMCRYVCTYIQKHIHPCIHPSTNTPTNIYIYIYIYYINIHTYIHTYVATHIFPQAIVHISVHTDTPCTAQRVSLCNLWAWWL